MKHRPDPIDEREEQHSGFLREDGSEDSNDCDNRTDEPLKIRMTDIFTGRFIIELIVLMILTLLLREFDAFRDYVIVMTAWTVYKMALRF